MRHPETLLNFGQLDVGELPDRLRRTRWSPEWPVTGWAGALTKLSCPSTARRSQGLP